MAHEDGGGTPPVVKGKPLDYRFGVGNMYFSVIAESELEARATATQFLDDLHDMALEVPSAHSKVRHVVVYVPEDAPLELCDIHTVDYEAPTAPTLLDRAKLFGKFTATRGEYQVTVEWIGEGLDGDYNEDDPEDRPILRLTVHKLWGHVNQEEVYSYATRLSPDISTAALDVFVNWIFRELPSRHAIERLTWTKQEELEEIAREY